MGTFHAGILSEDTVTQLCLCPVCLVVFPIHVLCHRAPVICLQKSRHCSPGFRGLSGALNNQTTEPVPYPLVMTWAHIFIWECEAIFKTHRHKKVESSNYVIFGHKAGIRKH